ncbi:MAG: tryptophan synthase subunit alpha [Prevotellaceae bacterium]|jgi:tryptophan synthase alpha chain|nr:tryptophan synthase subunit alpha [Prevotellaceae bacterium]
MNRIDKLFETKKKNVMSVYFTAGYPKLEDSLTIIRELEARGVDMVEIGIPFSDPMADGAVIQQSGAAALNNGMSLQKLFAQLAEIRKNVSIPLIMMGYLNSVMQFGEERFCRLCRETGIDGIIIPDLPFKCYMEEFKSLGEQFDLKFIMLITPETSPERIRLIDENTSGFIYMVSTASTTGVKDSFDAKTFDYFRRVNAMNLKNPRMTGFGISNRATFEAACSNANGAIIGSEFIRLLGTEPSIENAVDKLVEKCTLNTA